MKNRFQLLTLLTISFIFITNLINAQTNALQILEKMDKTMHAVKDKSVSIKMVMLNQKSQNEKVKEAVMIQKGPDMKLFKYTFPKSDSGIATLSLPNDEIYLYLPLFKNPKKITNLAESNAFNKSDFSVKDMSAKPYAETFTGNLISTNDTAYVIKLFSNSDDFSYGHLIVYINKEHFYPYQFDFIDNNGELEKKATYQYILINGYWVSKVASMEDLNKKSKTTLYMSDIIINQGLKDELFTVENMTGGS
jgi:outer membrane lipoprotein-sorting protein